MLLLIIILVLIGFWFSKMAQNHGGAKPWLWVISGIGGYFGGQLIAGFILGLVAPRAVEDLIILLVVGLLSGFLGVILARFLLINYAKKNGGKTTNQDILDDEDPIFDDLLD